MKQTMRVEGFSELEDALKELPRATGKNCIRRALTKAALPIVEAAKSMAPARPGSGRLRDAILVTKVKFTGGAAGKAAFAEAMRQGKTRAEAAESARAANVEAAAESGGAEMISGIAIIGVDYRKAYYAHFVEFGTIKMSPKPFLRPAWTEGKYAAVAAIKDVLTEEIEKAVKRIAKKQAKLIAAAKGS